MSFEKKVEAFEYQRGAKLTDKELLALTEADAASKKAAYEVGKFQILNHAKIKQCDEKTLDEFSDLKLFAEKTLKIQRELEDLLRTPIEEQSEPVVEPPVIEEPVVEKTATIVEEDQTVVEEQPTEEKPKKRRGRRKKKEVVEEDQTKVEE